MNQRHTARLHRPTNAAKALRRKPQIALPIARSASAAIPSSDSKAALTFLVCASAEHKTRIHRAVAPGRYAQGDIK
jgi:hypothetical protein